MTNVPVKRSGQPAPACCNPSVATNPNPGVAANRVWAETAWNRGTTAPGLPKSNAIAEAGEAGSTRGQGLGVAVQAHQDAVGCCPVQDRFGVSAAAEGAVENGRTGFQVEEFDALIEQYGHMVKVGTHEVGCPPNAPRRRATRKGQRREWGASNHLDDDVYPPVSTLPPLSVFRGHPNLFAGAHAPTPPPKNLLVSRLLTIGIHVLLDLFVAQERHPLLFLESLQVPEFDSVEYADHEYLGLKVRLLAHQGRYENSPLGVDGAVAGLADQESLKVLGIGVEVRQADQDLLLLLPLVRREEGQVNPLAGENWVILTTALNFHSKT